MEAQMHKRLKMHGAETSDSAYMVHSYTQSASCPASKPLPKENPLLRTRPYSYKIGTL